MVASGMGLCWHCTFFNKRYGFFGARYGFQSKFSFQRLTPVDQPGESCRWGVLAVAPAMLHVTITVIENQSKPVYQVCCYTGIPINWCPLFSLTTFTWTVFWPMGAPKHYKYENGVWIWYGFCGDESRCVL